MALFLPDANVLLYALHVESPSHAACRDWLQSIAAREDMLGLSELVEAALLRIPTLPKLQLIPMSAVLGFWGESLWNYPGTRRLTAGPIHRRQFTEFVATLELSGNDINDAWLAALAVEHQATLVSTDKGFARFPGLSWFNPVA